MLVVVNPLGPLYSVFTVTGTSTTGLNSTVHVRVTADPIGRMGLTGSLVRTIETGFGTRIEINKNCYDLYDNYYLKGKKYSH